MNPERPVEIQAFIRRLTTAVANASLYSLQHRQVKYLCTLALSHLSRALSGHPEVSLIIVDDELILDNSPLEHCTSNAKLVQAMKLRGISHVKFLPGTNPDELLGLIATLTKGRDHIRDIVSTDHIRYGQVTVRYGEQGGEDVETLLQKYPSLLEIAENELSKFTDLYESVRKKKKLSIEGISDIVGGFVDAFSSHKDPLLAIAPLRNLDEYTYTHSTNVCMLNLAQARMLGIEGQFLHEIGIAAMLHDIGKLFIPAEILQKPGQLDDKEWALMQEHPRKGAEYLLNTPGVPRLAVVTAYEHHIRFDCSGYPATTVPWKQHLCSHMTTISDFFDALRTHRSYRESLSLEQVSGIMMEQAGTTLHPMLTRNFLSTLKTLDRAD